MENENDFKKTQFFNIFWNVENRISISFQKSETILQPRNDGLQTNGDSFQLINDDRQFNNDGFQPTNDNLQPTSDHLQYGTQILQQFVGPYRFSNLILLISPSPFLTLRVKIHLERDPGFLFQPIDMPLFGCGF